MPFLSPLVYFRRNPAGRVGARSCLAPRVVCLQQTDLEIDRVEPGNILYKLKDPCTTEKQASYQALVLIDWRRTSAPQFRKSIHKLRHRRPVLRAIADAPGFYIVA